MDEQPEDVVFDPAVAPHLAATLDYLTEHLAQEAPPGGILHHYTSAVGLKGILRGESLWATNVRYLNDEAELTLGLELARDLARNLAVAQGGPDNDFERLSEYLDRLALEADNVDTPGRLEYYTTSFCERHDQLSLWNAYSGGPAGYSIGFSTGYFKALCVRIRYDEQEQRDLMQGLLFADEGLRVADPDQWRVAIASAALFASLACKHRAYEDEREWRLIVGVAADQHRPQVRVGASGVLIPHIDLPVVDDWDAPHPLPIVGVYGGPSQHRDLTLKGIALLLQAHGYPPDTATSASQIPIRSGGL